VEIFSGTENRRCGKAAVFAGNPASSTKGQMMLLIKNKRIQFSAGIVLLLLVVIIISLATCGRQGTEHDEGRSVADTSGGFTFYGLGAGNRLTEAIRERLSDTLGAETVKRYGTLDLAINHAGFLKQHFPNLHAWNARLNDPSGTRVEHNLLSISYRYPPRGKAPFSKVKLVFSNYTELPLYFTIDADDEGSSILAKLAGEYGDPGVVEWGDGQGVSSYWERDEDVLILSQITSRIGNPEYRIRIYFGENIGEMLSAEEALKFERERDQEKASETAF